MLCDLDDLKIKNNLDNVTNQENSHSFNVNNFQNHFLN